MIISMSRTSRVNEAPAWIILILYAGTSLKKGAFKAYKKCYEDWKKKR
jgi:hypothetical protein